MGVHVFTKTKNTDVWKKGKKAFFSYFITEIPDFSYMKFFRKCWMFPRSTPLVAISKKKQIEIRPLIFKTKMKEKTILKKNVMFPC